MKWALVLAALAFGCGDNTPATTPDGGADAPDGGGDGPPVDILVALNALPGVTATESIPPEGFPVEPGYRYFDLFFTQPIDHDHPELGTFQQYAALMHKGTGGGDPVVMYTSGYEAGWRRNLTEPAAIVEGNQLSLEYRFYGRSKPASAIDWSKLTVHQEMEDEHAIVQLLRGVYHGKWLQTGGSKGGENAMAHMHAHPEDLQGVVAYVAPVITDDQDARYDGILDRIGIADCRAKLRAAAREMLVRRTDLEMYEVGMGETYTRPGGLDHAYEVAVVELEFSFWMTRGEGECGAVPPDAAAATDGALYQFLVDTGGPSGYADAVEESSGQQYIYQDQAELGYPVWNHAYLDDLMLFSYEDWSAFMPPTAQHPTYNPAQPIALAAYLASSAEHVMHIGGEWDPWGAGYPAIETTNHESYDYRVAHGSHWSSGIYSLASAPQAEATAAVRRWAGLDIDPIAPPRRVLRAPLRELDPARR